MTAAGLKAVATGQVQTRPRTILDYLDDKRVHAGIAAVAGKFMSADRMLRLCVNAVKKAPKLAECDPQTVLGAMMTSAALGLEPNTVQQQAFLIPYNTKLYATDLDRLDRDAMGRFFPHADVADIIRAKHAALGYH